MTRVVMSDDMMQKVREGKHPRIMVNIDGGIHEWVYNGVKNNEPSNTKEYYFVSFMYGAGEKVFVNGVIDQHPFDWEKGANKTYPGQYVLTTWRLISKEEYDKYEGDVL